MKKIIFVCLFVSLYLSSNAQIATVIPSSFATANAFVTDTKTTNVFQNPANTAYVSSTEILLQYENRFLVKELSQKSLHFITHFPLVNIGISTSYFGYSQYNEILTGIALSRNFSDKFSMGVSFDYLTTYFIAVHRYYGAFFPQVGLNVSLSPNLHLGFSTFNPFQQNIHTEQSIKQLPSVFSLGLAFDMSPDLVLRTQFDQEVTNGPRFAAGMEYTMKHLITVKAGAYHSEYLIPCLGFSVHSHSISFHLNEELHPILGLITNAGVQYHLGKQ